MIGRKQTVGSHVAKFCKKKKNVDLEDPTPFNRSSVFWLYAKRKKGSSPSGPVQNRDVHKVNNDQGS